MFLNRLSSWGTGCLLVLLCAGVASCNRAVVEGSVLDVQGSPLPGVTVRARGGDAETTTDALGHYALKTRPDIRGLDFIKNGYTSGSLDLDVKESRTFPASAVSLWCLPQSAGVFLYEDYRYRRSAPVEPERFGLRNSISFGMGKLSDLEATASPEPLLICYKMPPYDVHMSRLHAVQAMSSQAGKGQQEAWIQEVSIPVELLPIDEPERMLLQVRAGEALAPGVYAVHWGALEGHTTTDPRMFMFRVLDPAHPEEAETAPEPPKPNEGTKPKPTQPEAAPSARSVIDTQAADAEGARPVP